MTFFGPIDERTTHIYTATLKDENNVVIPLSAITVLILTLYSINSGIIVNNRNAQNVLNANNVTVHATSGLLTWSMQSLDNQILDNGLTFESHSALFQWTLAGPKEGKHEVEFEIRNLSKIS